MLATFGTCLSQLMGIGNHVPLVSSRKYSIFSISFMLRNIAKLPFHTYVVHMYTCLRYVTNFPLVG